MNMPSIGQRVTCKLATEAYYSGYANNPTQEFRPGMVGIVTHIPPYVSRRFRRCRCEYFILVEFEGEEVYNQKTGSHTWQAGIDPHNAVWLP